MKQLYFFLLFIFTVPVVGYCQNQNAPLGHFFIAAGLNKSTTTITGDDPLTSSKPSSGMFPELNVGANVSLDKVKRDLFFKFWLGYTQNKGSFDATVNNGYPSVYHYQFNQNIISLNAQFAWNFVNGKNCKAYVAGGGTVDYGLYNNTKETATVTIPQGTPTTSAVGPIFVSNIFLNAVCTVGIVLNNRFEIYAKGIPSYCFTYNTNSSNTTLNTTSLRAGLAYHFE